MKVTLYHRRAPDFQGDILYPLHRLREVCDRLYERERANYNGREELLEQRVPMLECRWNDVLHFSPVHPEKIALICREEALDWRPARWFEFDATELGFDGTNSVIFSYTEMGLSTSIPATQFEAYSARRVDELTEVPQRTRDYVRQIVKTGEPHFIFAGVPHILHRNPLDVRQMKVITA